MSARCHAREAQCLTRSRRLLHNPVACSSATHIHRASHRTKYGGCFQGSVPNHSAIAPDLAGFPGRTPGLAVPALPSASRRFSQQFGFAVACSPPDLWSSAMAIEKTPGNAAASLGGDALAPRPGAAQPPLDLSLGHIGTIEEGEGPASLEVEDFGPFRVVFDPEAGRGAVYVDNTAFANRAERRAAERQFRKTLERVGGFRCHKSVRGHHE